MTGTHGKVRYNCTQLQKTKKEKQIPKKEIISLLNRNKNAKQRKKKKKKKSKKQRTDKKKKKKKKKVSLSYNISTHPVTSFGASPYIVSTDRICRLPLLTVFLYDQRLLTLETWCGYEYRQYNGAYKQITKRKQKKTFAIVTKTNKQTNKQTNNVFYIFWIFVVHFI